MDITLLIEDSEVGVKVAKFIGLLIGQRNLLARMLEKSTKAITHFNEVHGPDITLAVQTLAFERNAFRLERDHARSLCDAHGIKWEKGRDFS